MKKRFSIFVSEFGSDHEVELMQLDGDPKPIVAALWTKTLKVGKRRMSKYYAIRVVENDRDTSN